MSTIKCPQCKLVNWASQPVCKRCGAPLSAFGNVQFSPAPEASPVPAFAGQHFSAPAAGVDAGPNFPPPVPAGSRTGFAPPPHHDYSRPGYQNAYGPSSGTPYAPVKPKIKLAVISLLCGILGFPPISFFIVGLVGIVLFTIIGNLGALLALLLPLALMVTGLYTGISALRKAGRAPQEYGGKGLAIAGLVLVSLQILLIPIVAAIAVPNLLAARRSANEAAAISTVRRLSEAEDKYGSSGSGKCGDVRALIADGQIDKSLAKNEKSGYRFEIVQNTAGECEIHATPTVTEGVARTGIRSFFASSEDDWEIRAAAKNGARADSRDPLLKGVGNRE